jgi:hypothetical protein
VTAPLGKVEGVASKAHFEPFTAGSSVQVPDVPSNAAPTPPKAMVTG